MQSQPRTQTAAPAVIIAAGMKLAIFMDPDAGMRLSRMAITPITSLTVICIIRMGTIVMITGP